MARKLSDSKKKTKKIEKAEERFKNRMLYAGANGMYRVFEALCQEGVNYGYRMPKPSCFSDPYIREILRKYE